MESSFLSKSIQGICVLVILALVSTSAAMAETPSAVLAAYLDPYGEGIVTLKGCAIIVTTSELHTDEKKFSEMLEVVCAARSQATESRWQGIKEIYIVNRHGEGRLFEGGDQQCDELNQFEIFRTREKQQFILAHTSAVSAINGQLVGQCPSTQFTNNYD